MSSSGRLSFETSEDLIETVAYKLVERTFEAYPLVQKLAETESLRRQCICH